MPRARLTLPFIFVAHAVAIVQKSKAVTTDEKETSEPELVAHGTMLIVPEMKFLFCFIPKNACTQFNQLVNALNDMRNVYGDNCGSECPNFRSSAIGIRWPGATEDVGWGYSVSELDAVAKDPTWTKAVFLRDPLERLVSAHRSKCEKQECLGRDCLDPNFTRSVLELGSSDVYKNMHYVPQSTFCEGLDSSIQSYDYIGHVTKDYASMNGQVKEMMQLVLERNPAAQMRNLQKPLASGGPSGSTRQREVNSIIDQYFKPPSSDSDWIEESSSSSDTPPSADDLFPKDSDGAPEVHATGTEDGGKDYYTPSTAKAALKYYSADYKLPGLSVPDWALSGA